MVQMHILSSEVFNLVSDFLSKNKDGVKAAYSLMATLYTRKFGYPYPQTAWRRGGVRDAYAFVPSLILDMNKIFSENEIQLIENESSDVILYCCEYLEKNEKKSGTDSDRLTFCEGFDYIFQNIAPFENTEGNRVACLLYASNGNFMVHLDDCTVHAIDESLKNQWFDTIIGSACNHDLEIFTPEEYIEYYVENDLDYVIACPPIVNGAAKAKQIELFYHLILKALRKDGDFFAVLPMSFCYELSGWYVIRKAIFDNRAKFSMDVIALPAIFKPQTSIKMCLLHLKKDYQGNVVFMDATGEVFKDKVYFSSGKVRAALLAEDLVSNSVNVWRGKFDDIQQEKKVDFSVVENALYNDISQYDDVFELKSADLSFQPGHYLIENINRSTKEGENLIPFGELVTYKNVSARNFSRDSVVCVDTKNLTDDIFRYELDQDQLESLDTVMRNQEQSSRIGDDKIAQRPFGFSDGFKLSDYSIVGKGDLIITYTGGKCKFCRLIGDKECLLKRNRNTFVVSKIDERVTMDFFVKFLRSESFEKQASMLTCGIIVSNITRDNFSRIAMSVPSITEQEEVIKQAQRASLTQADKEFLENAEDFRKDMHVKKHAIGQTVGDMGSWVFLLEKAIEEGTVNPNIEIGRYSKTKLEDVISNISRCMGKLETQLKKFDAGYGMKPELIVLADYLEEYIQKNSRSGSFEFVFNKKDYCKQIVCDKDGNILEEIEGDPTDGIYFPKEALDNILDNIVANACKHGFENRTDNKIMFEVQYEPGGGLSLIVKNNGKEMSDNEVEGVFTYGVSSKEGKDGHYGIGGYEVRKLMKEFGGEASVLNWDPFGDTDEYTVVYYLSFTKTNLDGVYEM